MVVGRIAEPVDLVIAGAGPGGYVAALHGARRGRKVMLVDRDGAEGVGGVCLRTGCIPSKALIEAADLAARMRGAKVMGIKTPGSGTKTVAAGIDTDMKAFQAWKRDIVGGLTDGIKGLLKQAGVETIAGQLRLADSATAVIETPGGQARFVNFTDLVLATGSRPVALSGLPFDGKCVFDSTGALDFETLPKSVAIVGGGYIGIEIGTALAKLGSRVAIVEAEERILPAMEARLARPVAKRLVELGVDVRLNATAAGLVKQGIKVKDANGTATLAADKVVVAVGRRPNSDDLGLDSAGIEADNQGLLAVAADRRLAPHIAAIGDLTPGPALAHKAMAEAIVAVDALCGEPTAFQPEAIPMVVFSDPEIASAGLTVEQAKDRGMEVRTADVPLAASGRAAILGARDGFMQIVAERRDGTVVGVHMAGPHASDLIGEGVLAIELGASLEDLALSIHPHPSLSEQYGEAARRGLGAPIHGRS